MAVSYNKVIIAGNLTRPPELKPIGNDKSVTKFGLAINRRYKGSDGEMKEEVTFVDCEAWNRTGELLCQYTDKGSAVLVDGHLTLDQWETKEGEKRYKLKVVADSVQFLSFRDKGDAKADEAPAPSPKARKPATANVVDDEPPF